MAKKKYLKNPITGKKMGLVGLAALGVGGYLVYKKFIAKKAPASAYNEKAIIAEQKKTGKTAAQILWDQTVKAQTGKK